MLKELIRIDIEVYIVACDRKFQPKNGTYIAMFVWGIKTAKLGLG